MAENNDPAPPEISGSRQPAQAPRRHISAERQAQGQPANNHLEEKLADLVGSVRELADQINAEPTSAEGGDRIGRKVKKFQRSGVAEERAVGVFNDVDASAGSKAAASDQASSGNASTRGNAAFNKNVAWPKPVPPPAAPEGTVAAVRRKRARKRLTLVVGNLAGLGLLLVGFLMGHLTGLDATEENGGSTIPAARAPEGGGSERVNERVLQTADDALSAMRRGDQGAARKIYQDAMAKHVDLPGMHYQLASLAMERNDQLEADLESDRSREAGEFVAASYYIQARLAGLKNNYAEVARQLSNAAHTDPFNGRYFFYWAEALRRRGETHKAVEVLERALDRPHTVAEELLYLFKQRLARLEGGEPDFNAELDRRLKQTPVPGDWALLAAAREIVRSSQPAAAPFLKQAATTLTPSLYDLLVKDYLFQAAQDVPELSALLQRPVPSGSAASGTFVDPLAATAELADPAIWPTFSGKGS